MAANPISYQELDAFCRRRLVELTAWETGLLMRLDDAVMAIWAEKSKSKPTGSAPEPIPVSDTSSVRALLMDLAARKAKD